MSEYGIFIMQFRPLKLPNLKISYCADALHSEILRSELPSTQQHAFFEEENAATGVEKLARMAWQAAWHDIDRAVQNEQEKQHDLNCHLHESSLT